MKNYLIDLSHKTNESIKSIFKEVGEIDKFKINFKFEALYGEKTVYEWEFSDVYAGFLQKEDFDLIEHMIKHRINNYGMYVDKETRKFNTFDVIGVDFVLVEEPDEYESYYANVKVDIRIVTFSI